MPGAHRHDDDRWCQAKTIVIGQNNVYVNDKLSAVEYDICTHGGGPLKAIYGGLNIYINNILVIVAPGGGGGIPCDTAYACDGAFHCPNLGYGGNGSDDPYDSSSDVFYYEDN